MRLFLLISSFDGENVMRTPLIAMLIAGAFLTLNAQAVDLVQVYREALVNDPVYASARASRMVGEEKIPQGRAGLLPTIALGGTYTRVNQDGSSTQNTNYSSNSYTLSLSQPLFRLANWALYQEGKLSAAASEAQFAQVQEDLMVRVGQAYFDVLAAQDALAFLKAQETAITEQLASAKRNFEVGTATITDTHEAQARYDLALAQEIAAQNDLEIKRTALQQIIGKAPAELATLRPGVTLTAPAPVQINEWVGSAEQQNYTVIGQQLALEIAQHEISRNRAGHYPTLDLVASHTRTIQGNNSININNSAANANAIGVQWAIPIFSGFSVTSRVREAIALEDKARADLDNARRTAAQAARQSYLGVNNGLAQIKALEAAERSSQSALESNRLGYRVGVRINIDVLNAQQQLFSTRRDLAKARYDTLLNGLRLKSAAGLLKEDDLVQINALLQP
jgi:outer membrane protein